MILVLVCISIYFWPFMCVHHFVSHTISLETQRFCNPSKNNSLWLCMYCLNTFFNFYHNHIECTFIFAFEFWRCTNVMDLLTLFFWEDVHIWMLDCCCCSYIQNHMGSFVYETSWIFQTYCLYYSRSYIHESWAYKSFMRTEIPFLLRWEHNFRKCI